MRLSAFAAFFITPLLLVIKSQPPRVSRVSRIPCVSIPRATRPNGLRARVLTGLGLACALASTTLSAPAWAQVSDSDDTALMNLIAQASERVMLADTVARYKWAKKESITDPVREKALLASVARQAPNYGVEPQLAQTFFRDQIEANKVVQQGLIDGWHVAPPPPGPVPDLASSTRPQYDPAHRLGSGGKRAPRRRLLGAFVSQPEGLERAAHRRHPACASAEPRVRAPVCRRRGRSRLSACSRADVAAG